MNVKHRGVRLASSTLLLVALLAGCSKDETADTTVSTESVATESATTDTPNTEAAETAASSAEAVSTEALAEQTPTSDVPTTDELTSDTSSSDVATSDAVSTEPEAAVARLAKDDPTCVALDRVRKLNDQSGAVSNEFIGKALGAIGDGDATKIGVEFEKFLNEFTTLTEKILPDLKGAYADLARLQPQFATDLEKLESVTLDLLAAFKKMKASDLEKMEEFLAAEVSNEDMLDGGMVALKIDKFSRAACDIPFANT